MTLIILYLSQLVEELYLKNKRGKIVFHQRELYHLSLTRESQRMEEQQLNEDLKLAQSLENLQKDHEELKSQLDEDEIDGSDWSADSSDEKKSPQIQSAPDSPIPDGNKEHEVFQKLEALQESANQLDLMEEEIRIISQQFSPDLHDLESDTKTKKLEDLEFELKQLTDRIAQLEKENRDLKGQILEHEDIAANSVQTKLDSALIEYVERNCDNITLSFLKRVNEVLSELKGSNPDKNFQDLIDDLKSSHVDHATKLAELQVNKKEVEIKLKLLKRRYDEELTTFNETKIEHLFKNSGAKEFLDRLKERNRIKDDIISDLKSELDSKRRELTMWESKFREAEKQSMVYWQAWKDTQVKMAELEAEKEATHERDRRMAKQAMNFSPGSSLVDDQVPPPPPVSIPTIDELLQATSIHQASPYGVKMDSSVPPPPPIDDEEILRDTRTFNSSISGGYASR